MRIIICLTLVIASVVQAATPLDKAKEEASIKGIDVLLIFMGHDSTSVELRKQITQTKDVLTRDYVICLMETIPQEFTFDFHVTKTPVMFAMRPDGKVYSRKNFETTESEHIKTSVSAFRDRRNLLDKMLCNVRKDMHYKEYAISLGKYLLSVGSESPLIGYQQEIDELERLCKKIKDSYLDDANTIRKEPIEIIVITERLKQIRRALILEQPNVMIDNAERLLALKRGNAFYEQVAIGYKSVALWAMKDYSSALDTAQKAFCKDPKGPNSMAVKEWIDNLKQLVEKEHQVQDTSLP